MECPFTDSEMHFFFNVKMTREAQESYVYWIDVEEQEKTLRARSRDEAYPEVDEVYDQYRVK